MGFAQLIFGFQGRIRRTAYWLAGIGAGFVLGIAALVIVIASGFFAAASNVDSNDQAAVMELITNYFIVKCFPVYVVSLWITLALGIKRCHDRNYPGAMYLLVLIPFFGPLWALIDLGFIDGTPGPNRFGPSPKAQAYPPAQVYTQPQGYTQPRGYAQPVEPPRDPNYNNW